MNKAEQMNASPNYSQLVLTNEISQLSVMAAWIERLCDEHEASPALPMSINLALEEAVTNVILYAYPESDGTSSFTLDFDCDDRDLSTWRIIDNGIPFDPTAHEDADLTLGVMERPIGGLGIFLVKEIMDEVCYSRENEQNILTMKINLKKEVL